MFTSIDRPIYFTDPSPQYLIFNLNSIFKINKSLIYSGFLIFLRVRITSSLLNISTSLHYFI
jgi:hypothetical protein